MNLLTLALGPTQSHNRLKFLCILNRIWPLLRWMGCQKQWREGQEEIFAFWFLSERKAFDYQCQFDFQREQYQVIFAILWERTFFWWLENWSLLKGQPTYWGSQKRLVGLTRVNRKPQNRDSGKQDCGGWLLMTNNQDCNYALLLDKTQRFEKYFGNWWIFNN